MSSSAPRQRAERMLEHALFAAILIMTVAATFLYQAIVNDPLLTSFIGYLIGAYLLFLALAFGQLNALHRKRVAETRPSGSVMRKQELEQEQDGSSAVASPFLTAAHRFSANTRCARVSD
jgi:threonine/homoserine/homoserine lactone efflux protein